MPFSPFISNLEVRLPVEGQKLNLRGLEMIDVFGDNNLCSYCILNFVRNAESFNLVGLQQVITI